MRSENDQISCNMSVEKAESEKTDDIRTAGDNAEDGREYAYAIETRSLRW